MDKRFVAWLAVSMAIFVLYVQFLGPPPRKPDLDKPGEIAEEDAEPGAPNDAAGPSDNAADDNEPAAGGSKPDDDAPDAEEKNDVQPDADKGPDGAPAPEPEPRVEFVTLGSVEPDGPFRCLFTLTNVGAAVRRQELSSLRFRDLHDRSGYLGHLEATRTEGGGIEIRVVGAGTPAANARLEVGDVVTAIGDEEVNTVADFLAALGRTQPKEEAVFSIRRAGVETKDIIVTLERSPLDLLRPEIENLEQREEEVPDGFVDPASFLLSLSRVDGKELEKDALELADSAFRTGRWHIVPGNDQTTVTFRKAAPAYGIEILKTFTLEPVPEEERENPNFPAYHLTLTITIRSTDGKSKQVAYQLDGPTGLPTEGWWYANRISREWGTAGLRDVVFRYEGLDAGQKSASDIAEEQIISCRSEAALAYMGVDAQYFSSILFPNKPLETVWFDHAEAVRIGPEPLPRKTKPTYTNVTCRLHRKTVTLTRDKNLNDSYVIFCGPKRPDLLAKYQAADDPAYSLSDLIYYGWPIWGVVAGVMSAILHFVYNVVGNYGIAIICLTIVVRGLMFPLSRKQALNMAKMAELKPEMEKINEKYKNDLEKKTRAQQELWKKNNYNPMGGCLMAFVQLPIFIGLYRSLMIDVELRQAPLLGDSIRWCSNLSAPDMLFDWSAFMPEFVQGWLGPYFNILPLVTVGLFYLQQKLFMPPPMNEQAEMQQKVMSFMMLFMGVLFFRVASGLCVYFISSSLWGIAERKLLPSPPNQTPGAAAKPSGRDATAASSGSGGKDKAGRKGKSGGKKMNRPGKKKR